MSNLGRLPKSWIVHDHTAMGQNPGTLLNIPKTTVGLAMPKKNTYSPSKPQRVFGSPSFSLATSCAGGFLLLCWAQAAQLLAILPFRVLGAKRWALPVLQGAATNTKSHLSPNPLTPIEFTLPGWRLLVRRRKATGRQRPLAFTQLVLPKWTLWALNWQL